MNDWNEIVPVAEPNYLTTGDSVGKLHAALKDWSERQPPCKHAAVDCITIDTSTPEIQGGIGTSTQLALRISRFCCSCGTIAEDSRNTVMLRPLPVADGDLDKILKWVLERRARW